MTRTLLLGLTLLAATFPAVARAELSYDRGFLTEDTVWSGTVTLRGMNVVRRGSTLTILPGTEVRFLWSDDNLDGIGDGELTVEGRLVARGEKSRPIVFRSAREKPAPRDWTFVQLSQTRDSVMEHCILSDAFTAVQVHYSARAVLRDCTFRDNFEGLRFSTTDVTVEHCDFLSNGTAIRYESHGSRALVTMNLFQDNGAAFIATQRSTSTARFTANNVEGTRGYLVSVGENQREDLDFAGNWWGTADEAVVAAGMYDRSRDPVLGGILFLPVLARPVPGAGVR